MIKKILSRFALAMLGVWCFVPRVFAASGTPIVGAPHPKQLNFQDPASPVMQSIFDFHNLLLWIITAITIVVMLLLLYVIMRYNSRANPKPSTTTHHTLLEVVWTVIPILILLVIVVPSFKLLYFSDKAVNAEMTFKAIGKQWYWTYEYPDHGNFTFDSYILKDEEAKATGHPRLLGTDNLVVLPVDTTIRVLVTAGDVLHAFAVPSLGLKKDAVPGRTNETWVKIEKPGMYYGQCSELCGANHGFMPIAIKAVSKDEFAAWVLEAQKKFPKVEAPEGTSQLESGKATNLALANE